MDNDLLLSQLGLDPAYVGYGNVPANFICPRAEFAFANPNPALPDRYRWMYSYGGNISPFRGEEFNPAVQLVYRADSVEAPSDKLAMVDSLDWWVRYDRSSFYVNEATNSPGLMTAYRHGGNANMVMFDGHAESRVRDRVQDSSLTKPEILKLWYPIASLDPSRP